MPFLNNSIMKEETDAEPSVIKDRYRKLDELKKRKINPYPYRFEKKDNADEILKKHEKLKAEEHTKDKAYVAGRLMSLRNMG